MNKEHQMRPRQASVTHTKPATPEQIAQAQPRLPCGPTSGGGRDQREVDREGGAQARCAGGFRHRRASLAVENAIPRPHTAGPAPRYQESHMALLSKKTTIPAENDALPGRNTPMPLSGKHFVNGSNIKQPAAGGLEEAVFGLGCFWGAERKFWQIPGVVTTAVGYAGGYTPNATYEEVCSGRTGHTEVVRVIYDPNKVSYETLLKAFWESHDPTQGMRQGGDMGTQYRSAIYTTTDAQQKTAEASKRAYQEALTQGASRRPSPPRSGTRPSSTTPRNITSSTWRRIRTDTAGSGVAESPTQA